MTVTAVPTPLPFGMRDCKIYPYLDAQGTVLADTGFDLPNSQTFSFAEKEDFTDLRGDDDLVATHGNGAMVNWTLEAGGLALEIWAVFTGGQIIETGAAPNRIITLRKCSDDTRPYFRIDGQIMSDSGGDVIATVYRGKCNGDISGKFSDGQFFVTTANGIGLPIPGTKLLYDIAQHESKTFLTTAPKAIPLLPPRNDIVGNITEKAFTAQWLAVTGATGYKVQTAEGATLDTDSPTWVDQADVSGATQTTVTGLAHDTDYLVRFATKVGSEISYYTQPLPFHTLPETGS